MRIENLFDNIKMNSLSSGPQARRDLPQKQKSIHKVKPHPLSCKPCDLVKPHFSNENKRSSLRLTSHNLEMHSRSSLISELVQFHERLNLA